MSCLPIGGAYANVGRIYDRLVDVFGRERVFKDVDNILPGVDFRTHLKEALESSSVLIVVIDENWLDARSEAGQRRIDETDDYVRYEIGC